MASEVLAVENLHVQYDGVVAVRDLSIKVQANQTVALIGANGAGKTSALRAIGGQVRSTGTVRFRGEDVSGRPAYAMARRGLAQVPQGRRLIPELSVDDNIELGAYGQPKRERLQRVAEGHELFPRLAERRTQLAGSLSGGEQQMLAIARALAARPAMIAMDEPSLGLAPIIVHEVFETIKKIGAAGTAILLVEQNAVKALEAADHVYVLERGRVVFDGPAAQAAGELDLIRAYLV